MRGLGMLGRAQMLAGVTAFAVLLAAVIGMVVKSDGTATSALSSPGPLTTVAPFASDIPVGSLSPAFSDGPGRSSPAGTSPGASDAGSATPGPGGLVRGPAKGAPVRVGVHFNDNEGAAAQFGVGGLPDISDAEVQAVVTQVNKAGGLAGRPITPVFHRTDPLSGSFDAQGQEACESFADRDVSFVVDNALSPSKVLLDCLTKRKVPLMWELHMAQVSAAEIASHKGYLYRPSMPNADRYGFAIDALHRDGFFKGARVGILRYDNPDGALIANKVWKPRLAKYKIPVVAEAAMTPPSNAAGASGLAGQSSNAVLDFKDEDVSHVLFVPTGGAIPLTFLPAAASQGYEPRYGLTTGDAPDFIGRNFPESQLDTARVVGWAPDLDGDDFPRGAAFARCKAALAAARLPWDNNIQPYCDSFYLMHEALYAASSVTPSTLLHGVERIGTSFESPYVIGARFGPGRYDGPTKARLMRYDPQKVGWKYYGSIFAA